MYDGLTPERFDSLMQVLGPGSSTRSNCRGWELVAFGFLLGLAGSSFAVDVPFMSRWYAGPAPLCLAPCCWWRWATLFAWAAGGRP